MKQKNILFTDMDGTILFSDNGKTYFKESDLDAIKEFQQRGNLIHYCIQSRNWKKSCLLKVTSVMGKVL